MFLFALAASVLSATSRDETAIRTAIQRFIAAYNAGNVDALMTVYAPDFVDMPEGGATFSGQAAYRATADRLRATFREYSGRLLVEMEELVVAGEFAYGRGTLEVTLTPRAGGAVQHLRRRFLEVWRREKDGNWRVIRAMENALPDEN